MDFFKADSGSLWVRRCEDRELENTIKDGFDLWRSCNNVDGKPKLKFPYPIMFNTPIMKLGEERIVTWKWAKGNGTFDQYYYKVMAEDFKGELRIGWVRDDDLKECVPYG